MSTPHPAAMDREIARTLVTTLTEALAPGAGEPALTVARDVAQVLTLTGLDRVLAACQAHAGRPLPPEFEPVADRVRRVAAECVETGDLGVFRRADAELALLASELESLEWSGMDPVSDDQRAAVATLSLSRVLEDVALAGDDSRAIARRQRLAAPVAASLRAALDWLAPESLAVRSVRLHGEPSLLEVRLEQVNPSGLMAAHRVLSAVGGNLGPALEGDAHAAPGEWILRVPSFAARATFLLVIQGGLRLALPWHSVLRLRMMNAADLAPDAHRLAHPVLDLPGSPTPGASEYPVVLLAHGLKRANLIADRFVWRLLADPCDNELGSPAPGLIEAVSTDEGEVYWVAEPGRLLQRIELPALPAARRAVPEPATPTLTNADVAPLSAPAPPADAPAAPATTLPVTTRPIPAEHVGSAPAAGTPAPVGAPTPPASAPPVAVAPVPVVPLEGTPTAPASPVAGDRIGIEPRVDETPALSGGRVETPAGARPAPMAPMAEAVLPPTRPGSRPLRALVAEDSLTARVFLSRLLAQQGVAAEIVPTAAELLARVGDEPWALVLADVDLPDGHGVDWLVRVRQAVAELAPGARMAALVRDGADLDAARVAGVSDTLLKPFDRFDLEALLARLGLARS